MASSLFYQRLTFAFYCCVLWVALTRGEKEILLSEPQKGEQWIWQSDALWTTHGSPPVYSKCSIGVPERFFIRTPFIQLPPSVRTVEVAIVYSIKNCSVNVGPGILCSETFDLFKYERNVSLLEVEPDLFTDKVKTIRAGPGGLTVGNPADATNRSKDVIPVKVRNRGVYFAFFDRSACQALFSFEVSYRVCRKVVVHLASFERGNTANGDCVANAELSPNATSKPRAVCDIDGEWNIDSNVSCVCRAGYQTTTNGDKCVELKLPPSPTSTMSNITSTAARLTCLNTNTGFNILALTIHILVFASF